jgi:hypothetical protein
MTYLLIILIAILLFVGFLAFTAIEGHRGVRIFAGPRDQFDLKVSRAAFVLRHVDWSAFLEHLTRQGMERALHDAAHASLMLVRMLERILTRTVRTLRTRRMAELSTPTPVAQAVEPMTALFTEPAILHVEPETRVVVPAVLIHPEQATDEAAHVPARKPRRKPKTLQEKMVTIHVAEEGQGQGS